MTVHHCDFFKDYKKKYRSRETEQCLGRFRGVILPLKYRAKTMMEKSFLGFHTAGQ